MSSTVFVNGVTLSDDDWFNDVNGEVYSGTHQVAKTAAYQWTDWNPSDVAAAVTNAPATAVAEATATSYMTMANSSGTVTFTFIKAGRYLVNIHTYCDAAATASLVRLYTALGGTATRYITSDTLNGFTDNASAAQGVSATQTFLVSATAAQTLTILPKVAVTSGGITTNFIASANATATYVGPV